MHGRLTAREVRSASVQITGRLLAAMALTVGVYVTATTVWMVWQGTLTLPIADQWDEMVADRHVTLGWLFSQTNEHRMVLPRLIYVADYVFLKGTNGLVYASMVAMLATTAALASFLASAKQGANWIAALGISFALGFWAAQSDGLLWASALLYYCVLLTALGAFALTASARPSWRTLIGVVTLATLAAYSAAAGLAVVPITLLIAWWLGWPRRFLIVLALAGALINASYFIDYTPPGGSVGLLAQITDVHWIIAGFFIEIGAPFGGALIVSFFTGLAGLAVLGFLAWRGRSDRYALALVALAAFICAICFMTALGRGRIFEGLQYALTGRYMAFTVWFWAALLLTAFRLYGQRPLVSALIAAMLIVVCAKQATNPSARDPLLTWEPIRLGIPAFLADINDKEFVGRAYYGQPEVLFRYRSTLRSEHKSVFADPWAYWIGRTWMDSGLREVRGRCSGAIENVTPLVDTDRPGWRVIGRAWDTERDSPIARLVLISPSGVIVGYGLGEMKNLGPPGRTGFVGAAKEPTVTAYGILNDGSACRLG